MPNLPTLVITACCEKSPEFPSEKQVEDDGDVVSEEKTSGIPTPVEVSFGIITPVRVPFTCKPALV